MERSVSQMVAGWLTDADLVVAFTGAGVSTESGIPDFRSPGGVWAKYQPVYFDAFLADADARHEYWRQKAEAHRDFADAQPNTGHQTLARWEAAGRLAAVITQNIDGLHQMAGGRNVLELHGTAREVACLDCHARYEAGEMVARFVAAGAVPNCPACGGDRMKHATVSFGQALPPSVLREAFALSKRAKLFLAIGSSLVVEPAASLPRAAKQSGAKLVIVNRDPTPQDETADLVIREPIGAALTAIDAELSTARGGE
ncbi:MAG TPA: Sir2 family NAD-dependent protein deacetylase [Pirellulales bacterium]|nr:Sir2 family NAD-dependent protein deacetylase [Pirellulales bacterium]